MCFSGGSKPAAPAVLPPPPPAPLAAPEPPKIEDPTAKGLASKKLGVSSLRIDQTGLKAATLGPSGLAIPVG